MDLLVGGPDCLRSACRCESEERKLGSHVELAMGHLEAVLEDTEEEQV